MAATKRKNMNPRIERKITRISGVREVKPRLNRNCDYKYLNYRVYNLTYHINDTKIFPLKTYAYYNFIHCKQFGIPLYFK